MGTFIYCLFLQCTRSSQVVHKTLTELLKIVDFHHHLSAFHSRIPNMGLLPTSFPEINLSHPCWRSWSRFLGWHSSQLRDYILSFQDAKNIFCSFIFLPASRINNVFCVHFPLLSSSVHWLSLLGAGFSKRRRRRQRLVYFLLICLKSTG